MAVKFQPALTDSFPIKNSSGNHIPINKTVSEILAYGVANNFGDSFILIDGGRSWAGLCIKYFYHVDNVRDIYFATGDYLNQPNYYGVSSANATGGPSYAFLCNSNGDITSVSVGFNWQSKIVNNVSYLYQGGDISGYSSYGAIYVAGDYDNIYIDGNPLVSYTWSSVPAISGKNGILSLAMIKDEDIGDGSEVDDAPDSVLEAIPSAASTRVIGSQLLNGQTADYIYSGDVYKMTVSRTAGNLFDWLTLSFFLQPTTPGTYSAFYSYQAPIMDNEISNCYIGFIIDEENEVAALNTIVTHRDLTTDVRTVTYCVPGATMTEADMHLMWIWLRGRSQAGGDQFVDNDGDGGGDLVNRINNPIPTPGVPHASGYETGFMSQYMIGKYELRNLSRFLWSDSFLDNVKKFFEDPMQIIMGLSIMPVIPDVGDSRHIKAGGIDTGVSGAPLVNQFKRHPMGKVTVEKRLKSNDKLGGVYFDYSPYTEVAVYLPYCGEHSLDTNDVIGKTLQLDYTIDFVTGVCVAHITILDPDDSDAPAECHYNFSGQMGVQIPVSQADYSGIYRGILSAGITLGTAAATIASGGLTAPMATGGAMYLGFNPVKPSNAISLSSGTASRLANNVSNMHPVVQHTSGGGAVSGHVGSEYPYITISEPDVFQAENQPHYKGYPINATHKLGDMSGFVKIENIHFDGLTCTEVERDMISDFIKGGIIVAEGSSKPEPTVPTDEFGLVFLKNLSDPETVGKTFTDAHTITGKLLYEQDITHLRILVNGNYTAYNYCYVTAFDRFYFINKFEITTGGNMIVDMSVDALQSFKDEILNIEALIDSAEGPEEYRKMMMNNGYWYMKQKKNIVTQMFKDEHGNAMFFDKSLNGDERYILTIAGDSANESNDNSDNEE